MSIPVHAHVQRYPRLYFMGIAGTGMAAVAGMCRQAGYQVWGSDKNIYPPISDMLKELQIPVLTPYDAQNLKDHPADLYVVANSLSLGHPEIEALLQSGRPYVSFPQLLGEAFLTNRTNIVVAGTHGKTTTSALIAHLLKSQGLEPSYFIGGVPRAWGHSFALQAHSPYFVLEGDEYDTAFFDKSSKFLHYCPTYVVLNQLEMDHADIFKDLAAVEVMFARLLALVQDKRKIIANVDDPRVCALLHTEGLFDAVTRVSPSGHHESAHYVGSGSRYEASQGVWKGSLRGPDFKGVSLQTVLPGSYNFVNLCQGVALVRELCGQIRGTVPEFEDIAQWVGQFEGVKRRFEVLFKRSGGLHVYEDFAHHPTAVAHVIRTFKSMEPTKKLIVAFEPRNATSRRALFMDEYVQALGGADVVLLGALPVDTRIPTSERMDTYALARRIGPKAHAFATNAELEQWLKSQKHYQSAVMFMSSGDFSGIQHRLVAWLKHQVTWTPCEVPERAKNA